MMTLRKLCLCLILASLFLAARGDETVGGFKEEIGDALGGVYEKGKNLYDNLPPGGKFAAGAGAGFVGSRVAVNGATSAVKVAGAAFIVTEALNFAGAFDSISDGNKAFVDKVKNSALKSADNLRRTVRRRLAPGGIKNTIEAAFTTEKLATCGVAAGAFVGFML